jgi:hypothetical protein
MTLAGFFRRGTGFIAQLGDLHQIGPFTEEMAA